MDTPGPDIIIVNYIITTIIMVDSKRALLVISPKSSFVEFRRGIIGGKAIFRII
jgi:hypothetical protein